MIKIEWIKKLNTTFASSQKVTFQQHLRYIEIPF